MKNVSIHSRFAVVLLVAALASSVGASLFVIQLQLAAIFDLAVKVTDLTNEVGRMKFEMQSLVSENASYNDTSRHIAVALKENKLYLMEGRHAIREIKVASGSGRKLKMFGKEYDFSTPPGEYAVTSKETDPVWIAPDWYWLEKGESVPENITQEERTFHGHLGKYRLNLRDGIGIHGTDEPWSIGRYVSHGCIRVGAKDLEILFNSVTAGTKVYIY